MVDNLHFLYPLNRFYELAGLPLPEVSPIKGEDIAEPYRSLLVHRADMTTTLENYHRARCHLNVLVRHDNGDTLSRQVVLALDGSDKPVEFGAITIYLARFAPEVQSLIRAGHRPLGAILHSQGVEHSSLPRAFIRVISDALMNEVLQVQEAGALFGRRNTLFDHSNQPLADIVEILPPV